jgi:hypothetical protein
MAFKDRHFWMLIRQLRERERLFFRKERVWREISAVHAGAISAVSKGRRLSRRSTASEMQKPGSFCGKLARSYLAWLKRRLRAGDRSVLRPKHVPLDVRAYWSLEKASKITKAG